MLTYYPSIRPFKEYHLAVGDGHSIYVEECGKPYGLPILFVHGGPGVGCNADHRRFFDPNIFHIILFDQRGCGRSAPHGEVQNNTTQLLLRDMEKIRQHLNIEKWLLFGGSWGSTLSLVYAETFPERVLGLILRGIFLNRQKDVEWLYQYGANQVFPDYWDDLVSNLPVTERDHIISAMHRRFHGKDDLLRMAAAKAWASWESRTATLNPNPHLVETFCEPNIALAFSKISSHYFINHCFMEENQILNNIDKLENIPGIIVHGRYDMLCTVENAWTLNKAWKNSQLNIVRDAGHAASEPGNIDALIRATQAMAQRHSAA